MRTIEANVPAELDVHLEDAIRAYLARNNEEPKPFIWTKSADAILDTSWIQRVYSASSSNESAQDLPQKRRTLSSGLSQYQQAPLGGRLRRVGKGGSTGTLLSGKDSCVVSKLTPLPAARR